MVFHIIHRTNDNTFYFLRKDLCNVCIACVCLRLCVPALLEPLLVILLIGVGNVRDDSDRKSRSVARESRRKFQRDFRKTSSVEADVFTFANSARILVVRFVLFCKQNGMRGSFICSDSFPAFVRSSKFEEECE